MTAGVDDDHVVPARRWKVVGAVRDQRAGRPERVDVERVVDSGTDLAVGGGERVGQPVGRVGGQPGDRGDVTGEVDVRDSCCSGWRRARR